MEDLLSATIKQQLKKIRDDLLQLKATVQTTVEKIDINDILSDVENAIEKFDALQTYQQDNTTNYDLLCKTRLEEIKEYENAKQAFIRSQIWSLLLKNSGAFSLTKKKKLFSL